MCFCAIHWANISEIIYGARIADAKKLGFNELPIGNKQMKKFGVSPIKIHGDFLREECLGLFELWVKRKDRLVY